MEYKRSRKGEPGDGEGEEDQVTDRLPWPRECAKARDQAAEWINEGREALQELMDGKQRNDHEILLLLVTSDRCFENAQRWLESAGASTRPDSIEEVRR